MEVSVNIVEALSGASDFQTIEPNADGLVPLDITVTCNTNGNITRDHVRAALTRGLPEISPIALVKDSAAILVGGGPSLKDYIEEIRAGQKYGLHVFGLNGATRFLNEHGIIPENQVILDPRPENIGLIGDAQQHLIASQCSPEMFDALKDKRVILFHAAGSALKIVNATCIGGSVTVGLTAICLAYTMGYETLHLYGYDSSYAEGEHHAYAQDQTDQEKRILDVSAYDASGKPVKFVTNFAMAKQAELFPGVAKMITDAGGVIAVHGKGLLPTMAQAMVRPIAAE